MKTQNAPWTVKRLYSLLRKYWSFSEEAIRMTKEGPAIIRGFFHQCYKGLEDSCSFYFRNVLIRDSASSTLQIYNCLRHHSKINIRKIKIWINEYYHFLGTSSDSIPHSQFAGSLYLFPLPPQL